MTFHKGRGTPDDPLPILEGDSLGGINFSGSTPTGIASGARITAKVIAPFPSETDMETKVCIYAADVGSTKLEEIVCFSHADGMVFSNPAHQPRLR